MRGPAAGGQALPGVARHLQPAEQQKVAEAMRIVQASGGSMAITFPDPNATKPSVARHLTRAHAPAPRCSVPLA